jgi:hypothetical protein
VRRFDRKAAALLQSQLAKKRVASLRHAKKPLFDLDQGHFGSKTG